MTTEALRKPTKDNYNLVRFAYGAGPTLVRYTDWTQPVVSSFPRFGGQFDSLPDMAVTIPKKTGTLSEDDCKVVLPLTPFAERISNGEPHADVRLHVMEYVKAPTSQGLTLVHFVGDVFVATRNHEGRPDRVLVTAKSWKGQLEQKCGFPVISQCANGFGDVRCGIDVEALAETATIDGVTGKRVVLLGLAAHVDRYWHTGYLEKDGLRIRIRDWLSGMEFELGKAPPADWIGAEVTVKPGCNKLVGTCRTIWANEGRFNGAGYKVAARNAVFEAR